MSNEQGKTNSGSALIPMNLQSEEVIESKGVVVYLDVLGYKSFLKNNESITATREVLKTISNIGTNVLNEVVKKNTTEKTSSRDDWSKYFRCLILSDTIILFVSVPHELDKVGKLTLWLTTLHCAEIISRRLFDFGLPVRGAVTHGEFIVDGNCFAGRSIVEAHLLASKIDLAACVISQEAQRSLKDMGEEVIAELERYGIFSVSYLVPFKDGTTEKMKVIPYRMDWIKSLPDITQAVVESFWKHGKDVEPCAYSKIKNTEMFLRYLRMKEEIAAEVNPS